MPYIAQDAPDCLVVDTSQPVGAELAQRLYTTTLLGLRIQGVGQYVGLHTNGPWDITQERLAAILETGLAVWLIQHCFEGKSPANPGWTASAALGAELGVNARRNANLVGYAEGAHLVLDLEGCASSGAPVVDFVNAWADQVKDVFSPLVYVGYDCGLSAEQLYEALPDVHAYGSDAGPREVATRGFVWKQHPETTLHLGTVGDLRVDPGTLRADALGGRLRWMVKQGV
jgi:Rv2525c-like, glycoside hydrolase-like domain